MGERLVELKLVDTVSRAIVRRGETELIRLVLDKLNSGHGTLYELFPPEEARRILDRLAFHDTPTPRIWLGIAETKSASRTGSA